MPAPHLPGPAFAVLAAASAGVTDTTEPTLNKPAATKAEARAIFNERIDVSQIVFSPNGGWFRPALPLYGIFSERFTSD
jgi:hypothetical protein